MAECMMCGASHDRDTTCPEQRCGQTVAGKYAVGELLGVGGMSAVYAATHVVLQREVALKILHKRFASDAELGARFVREARATAAVGHPAFVAVYDAGTNEDGCAFIEMDRLDGRDVYSMRKATGPMPIDFVVDLAIAVLDALSALHRTGVIHRDLKSANVFLTAERDGRQDVRILDLGFAKVEDALDLTSPDALLGTPYYISPEQYFDPTSVDARTDLFSLGIVMFELLTGGWPYTYTSKRELFHNVLHGELERNPARRREEIPEWLDAVVARALAHDRDARFESADEMRDALLRKPARPGLLKRWFGR
jgi:serine/threonine-protein kinase